MTTGTIVLRAAVTLLIAIAAGALTFPLAWYSEIQFLKNDSGIASGSLTTVVFLVTLTRHRAIHRIRFLPRILIVAGTFLLLLGTGVTIWANIAASRHLPRGPFDGIQFVFYQFLGIYGGVQGLLLLLSSFLSYKARLRIAMPPHASPIEHRTSNLPES